MGYSHSFAPEFYWGEGGDPYDPNTWADTDEKLVKGYPKPTNLAQALWVMPDEQFAEACHAVGVNPEAELAIAEVIEQAQKVDYVENLGSPARVHLDSDGDFVVEVYDA